MTPTLLRSILQEQWPSNGKEYAREIAEQEMPKDYLNTSQKRSSKVWHQGSRRYQTSHCAEMDVREASGI